MDNNDSSTWARPEREEIARLMARGEPVLIPSYSTRSQSTPVDVRAPSNADPYQGVPPIYHLDQPYKGVPPIHHLDRHYQPHDLHAAYGQSAQAQYGGSQYPHGSVSVGPPPNAFARPLPVRSFNSAPPPPLAPSVHSYANVQNAASVAYNSGIPAVQPIDVNFVPSATTHNLPTGAQYPPKSLATAEQPAPVQKPRADSWTNASSLYPSLDEQHATANRVQQNLLDSGEGVELIQRFRFDKHLKYKPVYVVKQNSSDTSLPSPVGDGEPVRIKQEPGDENDPFAMTGGDTIRIKEEPMDDVQLFPEPSSPPTVERHHSEPAGLSSLVPCKHRGDCFQKYYANVETMEAHYRITHMSPNICPAFDCGKKLDNQREFDRHIRAKHDTEPVVPCMVFDICECDELFMTRSQMEAHVTKHHPGVLRHGCGVGGCSQRFHSWIDMKSHVSRTHMKRVRG